jgi:adenylate cyclase
MHKWLVPTIIAALLSVVIIFFLSKTSTFGGVEEVLYDLKVQYFAPKTQVSDKIVMIWLDEETIKGLPYRSPVPRDFLANLNKRLAQATPLLIAYDIFFQDPTKEEFDTKLAESFSGWNIYSVSAGKDLPDGTFVEEKPLPIFQEMLSGYALSDLPISAYDSTVRHYKPYWIVGNKERPTFASLLYKAATGRDATAELKDSSVRVFGFTFRPFYNEGGTISAPIRYAGAPGKTGDEDNAFVIFPAYLVVAGLVPNEWLSGKIILVGSAYEFSQDAFLTPYFSKRYSYSMMNGVEIHANILNSLLTREFYYLPSHTQQLVLLALLSLFASFLAIRWHLIRSAITLLIVIGLYLFVNLLFFKKFAVILPAIAPLAAIVLSFGISLTWRAMTEGRQKKFIKNVFSRYVPQAVVDQMLGDPSRLVLGGETRKITSLFTDIESFTTISEQLSPEVLVSFLNEYLSKVSDIIFKYGGTIDKYEGDAVIAFFGAPLEVTNHEEVAVRAALEIQRVSKETSDKWGKTCGREIVTRIGISSGPAVVGNMGSDERFDYTAIGDTVNLASRLEGTNKNYGTRVLISEATMAGLSKEINCKFVDEVKVKGKDKTVKVYEPA